MKGTQRWITALAAAAALGAGWYVSAQDQPGQPPAPPAATKAADEKTPNLAELQAQVRELQQEVRKLRKELHERSGPPGMREHGGPRSDQRSEGRGFGRGPEREGPHGPPPWARGHGERDDRGEGRGFGRGPEREGPHGPPPWARGHGERDDRGMSDRKGGRCERCDRPPEGDRYREGSGRGWDRGGSERDWRRPMPPPPPRHPDDRDRQHDDRDGRPRHPRHVDADHFESQRPIDL